jgi:hypothetical protein
LFREKIALTTSFLLKEKKHVLNPPAFSHPLLQKGDKNNKMKNSHFFKRPVPLVGSVTRYEGRD